MTSDAPIPCAVQELLTLFQERCEELRFPDVDLPIFEALVDEVEAASALVHQRQAELDDARGQLDEHRARLLKNALRGWEYAKVYASEDAELTERIDAIALAPKPVKKPRKARRKKDAQTTQLALAKDTEVAGDQKPTVHDEPVNADATEDAA